MYSGVAKTMYPSLIGVLLLAAHTVYTQDTQRCYIDSCGPGQCCRAVVPDLDLMGDHPSCQPLQNVDEFCTDEINEDLDAFENACPCKDNLVCLNNTCESIVESEEPVIFSPLTEF
uniref:Prokineticin domain-containing protein n=2 Tax=Cuerna arida TaxID=1464854 RepID=A0A1B6F5Q9_9HEMI